MMYLGCAGWSIPHRLSAKFPGSGSHLQRHGAVFNAVEINSSFYRPHRHDTYERWAASVPAGFRFSVKLPRAITHENRLRQVDAPLEDFLAGVSGLGARLGCLLAQLPPSLEYRRPVVEAFLDALQRLHGGAVALEPRHPSWFDGAASALLAARHVARVGADPPRGRGGEQPAGHRRALSYFRLHGAPRVYHSAYDAATIAMLARRMQDARQLSDVVWCIFDNTALGAAPQDALALQALLADPRSRPAAAGLPSGSGDSRRDAETGHEPDAGDRDQQRAGEVEQQAGTQHVRHAHPAGAENDGVRRGARRVRETPTCRQSGRQ
jgi:uncharacterized protein YecE (DUF72 family)